MPDRYGDEPPTELDVPDDIWAAGERHTAQAIVDCPRCDDDGYCGGRVCDHRDRDTTRGRALMRAELQKIEQRRAQRARGGAQ